MAKRNQLGGALGGHDSRDAGRSHHVALLERTAHDYLERFGTHRDDPLGASKARGVRLVSNVYHSDPPSFVEVRKVFHRSVAESSRISFAVMSWGLTLLVARV